jgi:hypothetical protein
MSFFRAKIKFNLFGYRTFPRHFQRQIQARTPSPPRAISSQDVSKFQQATSVIFHSQTRHPS